MFGAQLTCYLRCAGVDVYSCLAGATGALYGPLHGGACEAVLRMLASIGYEIAFFMLTLMLSLPRSVEAIPQFIEDVKNRYFVNCRYSLLICFGL